MKSSTLVLFVLISTAIALSPAEWRSQSIYQIITDRFARTDNSTTANCDPRRGLYCGGTWQGIINKLDYIQGMGFTAIWISPVVEQVQGNSLDGEAYHGYWTQNIYELNTNFGTKSGLIALSNALHSRGMYLMVDFVTNHMAYKGCPSCVDYSVLVPFNQESYYHPYCPINWTDPFSIQNCWVGDNIISMPDLRTEDAKVSNVWNTWIKDMVSNYNIDGFRMDSTYEVNQASLRPLQDAAGVYIVGEVYNGDPNVLCGAGGYQDYMLGLMNFVTYFQMREGFRSINGSLAPLVDAMNTMNFLCADTTLMASFIENHDLNRFFNYTSDTSLIKNAMAFNMLNDGIPIVYYGTEQGFAGGTDPFNREALWTSGYPINTPWYKYIAKLNLIRTQAVYTDPGYVTSRAYVGYFDMQTMALRKGNDGAQIFSILSTLGENGPIYNLPVPPNDSRFTPGQLVTEVLSCTSYEVDSNGWLQVAMANGLPRIFRPTDQLANSTTCGL